MWSKDERKYAIWLVERKGNGRKINGRRGQEGGHGRKAGRGALHTIGRPASRHEEEEEERVVVAAGGHSVCVASSCGEELRFAGSYEGCVDALLPL